MGLEAEMNLFEQLWDHLQVNLGRTDIHVPKECGQKRQFVLYVLSVPVPAYKAMDGKRMAEGMKTGTPPAWFRLQVHLG